MSVRMLRYLLRRRQDARDAIAEAMRGDGVTRELHQDLVDANADVEEFYRERALAAAARGEQDNNTQRRADVGSE